MVVVILYPYKTPEVGDMQTITDGWLKVFVTGFLTEEHAEKWADEFLQFMKAKGVDGIQTGVMPNVAAGDLLMSAHSTMEEIYADLKLLDPQES